MRVTTDEAGWSIDIPCLNCHKYNCAGSVHMWIPNRQLGNTENGCVTKQEAIAEAQQTSKTSKRHCFCNENSNR